MKQLQKTSATLKLSLIVLQLLCVVIYYAQTPIKGTDVYQRSVKFGKDNIDFITTEKELSSKPVILFLQGSLPIPLVFDLGNYKHVNIPFERKAFSDYEVVVISMPNTPVEVGKSNLSPQYCYVTDTAQIHSFDEDYLKNNVLDVYVKRANKIIKELKKSDKKREIHVIGHSQGAKVAAVVASKNKQISTVSLLGFNAFGRMDEMIRRERISLKSGRLSPEDYRSKLYSYYGMWQEVVDHPDDHSNGNNSMASFSIDYTPYLVKVKCPMFIGYGTEDIIAENCDLLPLKLIEAGKMNFYFSPFVGWDHNFFEVENGKVDYKKDPHWTDVIMTIVDWTKGGE